MTFQGPRRHPAAAPLAKAALLVAGVFMLAACGSSRKQAAAHPTSTPHFTTSSVTSVAPSSSSTTSVAPSSSSAAVNRDQIERQS
jgi:hypothetical protein